MAVHDIASGPGGFGLGGSGDDPNRNQPGAFPPDPNGVEPMRPTRTKAGQHNRNSQFGVQAGQEIQAGGMLELAQLRQDFVQLQQDLAQERQARMQLEGRVNDIQQQLQQGGQISNPHSSSSDSDIDDRLVAARERREAIQRDRQAIESEDINQQIQEAIDALQAQQDAAQEMDREHRERMAEMDRELQA